ncbi:MAG: ABC transporter ATP-binding protein [Clostridiales bacterium]|nr:ABC transporter ATP-binding protein [Clostridiales bacterium]
MNLSISELTVRYGKRAVLDNVSHEFSEGLAHCLIGPNGCGKTTLIKALVEKYAASGEISYVPQDVYGQIALTVYDTVALGRYDRSRFFSGLTKEDKEKVDKAIEIMGLSDLTGRIFDTLSGGEKQRCMVARAIAQDTPWTILDEPSSNLDVKHNLHIMKTFRELKEKEGKSFIIVLHDVNTAAEFADRFVVMKEGRIVKATDTLDREMLSGVFEASFSESITPSGRKVFFAE